MHRHDRPLSALDLFTSLEVFDLAAVVVDQCDRAHEILLFGKTRIWYGHIVQGIH